ncbi:MAG: thioredoxin domain-containing protein, partial [Halobacteriaceae archaeon]
PSERSELEERADRWMNALQDEFHGSSESNQLEGDVLLNAADGAVRAADREHGGFGRGQKFPQAMRLELLIRAHDATGTAAYLEVVSEALDAIVRGGLRDHLAGGFHRYCTDRQWKVPHFEKMLYDNALLPPVLNAAHQVTGDERYATASRETLQFLQREMKHPEGGFYSSIDADTEEGEGNFYTWTPEEIDRALSESRAVNLIAERFDITETGDTEDQRSVLTRAASISELASSFDLSEDEVTTLLESAMDELRSARAKRQRPERDEKILAGWNGLAISAFADAAIALDESFKDVARETLEFCRANHWDGDHLYRRYRSGNVGIPGYLDDHAYLARGALDAYGVTGDPAHCRFALELGTAMIDTFWDEGNGSLSLVPADTDLPARPPGIREASLPAAAGIAADVLWRLDHLNPSAGFDDVARSTLESRASEVQADPVNHPSMVLAMDLIEREPIEVIPVGGLQATLRALRDTHVSPLLLAPRPVRMNLEEYGLDSMPPIWRGRDREGTCYVCRDACSPPLSERDEIVAWLNDFS